MHGLIACSTGEKKALSCSVLWPKMDDFLTCFSQVEFPDVRIGMGLVKHILNTCLEVFSCHKRVFKELCSNLFQIFDNK